MKNLYRLPQMPGGMERTAVSRAFEKMSEIPGLAFGVSPVLSDSVGRQAGGRKMNTRPWDTYFFTVNGAVLRGHSEYGVERLVFEAREVVANLVNVATRTGGKELVAFAFKFESGAVSSGSGSIHWANQRIASGGGRNVPGDALFTFGYGGEEHEISVERARALKRGVRKEVDGPKRLSSYSRFERVDAILAGMLAGLNEPTKKQVEGQVI